MKGGLPERPSGEPLVKICGARRESDLLAIRAAGADLAGMVFAPSKRRLDPLEARAMVPVLEGTLPVVGVFVERRRRRDQCHCRTCAAAVCAAQRPGGARVHACWCRLQ